MNAVALSHLVGPLGKVIAFEARPILFREAFWNLVLNQIQNVRLFCVSLNEQEKTLDSLQLEDVALICINAKGREDRFLEGARETIEAQKPVLLINLMGGIPIERADRFIRDEFQRRIDEIHSMGYTTQYVSYGAYLALPNS